MAELYSTMPSLASCGFVASMVSKHAKPHSSFLSEKHGLTTRAKDDASAAVAAIPRKLHVDTDGLAALVSDARNVLDDIPR